MDKQMVKIMELSSQFSRFKNNWNNQAGPYNEVPFRKMLAHIDEVKIHADLKRLQMCIDKN